MSVSTASFTHWYQISGTGVVQASSGGSTDLYDISDGTMNDAVPFNGSAQWSNGSTNVTVLGTSTAGDPIIYNGTNFYVLTNSTKTLAENVGVSYSGYTFCFMPGTLIETPQGARPVESLSIGDRISIAGGGERDILWIGLQTVASRFADPDRTLPVEISAGALGDNLPTRALRLSPDHGVSVAGIVAQAKALVNGTTIRQLRHTDLPQTFTYYHIETEDHALLIAEGLGAETFVDNVSRRRFDNWAEYAALFGDAERAIPEMAVPRAQSTRQLPKALQDMLFGPPAKTGTAV